jgi:hypothetical protein
MRHSFKGMYMQRKTLTLKSISKVVQSQTTTASSVYVQAGRTPKTGHNKASPALFSFLGELVKSRSKIFIQMRHGAGYCGIPVQIKDGWLTMKEVSIHGTKQSTSSQSILIQIRDGSFIGHLHAVESNHKNGA